MSEAPRMIRNGRAAFALHPRKAGEGTPLLLLHELFASAAAWSAEVDAWPGPVFALDFAGHGASDRLRGGSYGFDRHLSDADLALREIGTAALAGAGAGAWYGLIVAGTRPERVPGCLLLPGAGLAAGGDVWDPMDVRPRIPGDAERAAFEGGPLGVARNARPHVHRIPDVAARGEPGARQEQAARHPLGPGARDDQAVPRARARARERGGPDLAQRQVGVAQVAIEAVGAAAQPVRRTVPGEVEREHGAGPRVHLRAPRRGRSEQLVQQQQRRALARLARV